MNILNGNGQNYINREKKNDMDLRGTNKNKMLCRKKKTQTHKEK